MQVFGFIFGILVTIIAAFAIIKKYQANMVLFLAGLVLNIAAVAMGSIILPDGTASTGLEFLDVLELVRTLSRSQILGVGFIILISGGFAAYIQAIGASDKFIELTLHPMARIKNPYFILAIAFIFGNLLGFAIPSATGLAMLAIITIYPLLINMGCSPLSVSAIIASCMAVSYAPISGGALLAAEISGITPLDYLLKHQLPMAVPVVLVMAMTHALVQKHFDHVDSFAARKERIDSITSDVVTLPHARAPIFYAFFPFFPIILMLIFNPLIFKGIKFNVATAMLGSWALCFLIDLVWRRRPRRSFDLSFAMFRGMGRIMTSTVGLLFMAAYFTYGLHNVGMIDYLLKFTNAAGFSAYGSSLILTCMVGLITIITGSGTAAFTSLAHIVPEVSASMGIDSTSTILMMNTTSEMLRAISPIAGVVIVVAGYSGLNPFEVAKRATIPCVAGFITMLTAIALKL